MNHTPIFFKLIEAKDIPIIVLSGGSGSSKTISALQRIIRRSIKYQGTITSIVSETLPQLKKGAERDFFNILKQENIYNIKCHHESNRIYEFGKSKVEFFSADNILNALGARRDYLYINEAIRINWDTAFTLMRYTNVQSIIDFNPAFQFWAHTELRNTFPNESELKWIDSTYRDNPFLPKMQKSLLLKRGEIDINFRKVYVDGEIGSNEGLIFDAPNIVQKMPEYYQWKVYGLDFGFSNSQTALSETRLSDGMLWHMEHMYQLGLLNSDIERLLIQEGVKKSDLIVADSAEPKSIEELKRRGWNIIGAIDGKPVKASIDLLRQYKHNVTVGSTNLINEFRNYSWAKDKQTGKLLNAPVKLFDHLINGIMYSCYYKLTKPVMKGPPRAFTTMQRR